jgi:hypothetical protein
VWEEKFWRKDLVCCIDERDLNTTHIPSLFLIESSYKLTNLQIPCYLCLYFFFCSVCTSSYLNLHIPAERKRRADEAQQSSMGNGASAENGATAVTFSFFPPPLFLVHTCVCVCIIFALSGILGRPIRYLSLLTLMWRNVYLLQWLCDCCFRTTISLWISGVGWCITDPSSSFCISLISYLLCILHFYYVSQNII